MVKYAQGCVCVCMCVCVCVPMQDTSDVYGEGFRDAYEAFTQRGLTAVVNDVLRRGTFM